MKCAPGARKHMQRLCGRTEHGRYKALQEGILAGGERVRARRKVQGDNRICLWKGRSGFSVESRGLGLRGDAGR